MQHSTNPAKLVYRFALVFALFAAFYITSCKNSPIIRVDGVYQSKKNGDTFEYLRFYPDGSVITVSSTGTAADIAKWFNKSGKDLSKGNYTLTGQHLKFSSTDSYGTVDYDGDIKGDVILLKTYSHINGYHGSDEYLFVKN